MCHDAIHCDDEVSVDIQVVLVDPLMATTCRSGKLIRGRELCKSM